MGFQTTYALDPGVAYPGMLGDSGITDKLSRVVANATIAAGLAVVHFATDPDRAARSPTLTGQITAQNLVGVSIFEPSAPNAPYAVGDQMSVLRRGRIWVNVEEAVTPESPVFIRFAAGSFPTLGAFRTSADTASAVQVANGVMRFLTTQATIGGLALLEVNLP